MCIHIYHRYRLLSKKVLGTAVTLRQTKNSFLREKIKQLTLDIVKLFLAFRLWINLPSSRTRTRTTLQHTSKMTSKKVLGTPLSSFICRLESWVRAYYFLCPYYVMSTGEAISLHIFTIIAVAISVYYTGGFFCRLWSIVWRILTNDRFQTVVDCTIDWLFFNASTSLSHFTWGNTTNEYPIDVSSVQERPWVH